MLKDGYFELPAGKLAAVVTYLEMIRPAAWIEEQAAGELRKLESPAPEAYRRLFRRIGENWLWFSRLRMTDTELTARLAMPGVEVYEFHAAGAPAIGLVELERDGDDGVQIALFGLAPEYTGLGLGRGMMAGTLRLAWAAGARRVWLHTCTLDHPKALQFYRRSGFRAYARGIEIADDPRWTGVLPESAAPRIPLIRPDDSDTPG